MARRGARKTEAFLSGTAEFDAFYADNSRPVLAFFVRRVFDPEIALDLTAETFAQALLSRARFRGDSADEARAWLYGIARHQLGQYHRRGAAERRAVQRLGIERPALTPEDYERIEELIATEPLRAAARNGMNQLSDAERSAIRLRVVDELPYSQVAERLGISPEAARARVSRGLRELAERVGEYSTEEELSS